MTGKIIIALTVCALTLCSCAAVVDAPIERTERFAKVGKTVPIQLAYRERGQGKPLLMIHGFGASVYTWRHIEPELAAKYRVISIDLKGFGNSDKPRDEKYSIFDQTELVSDFILAKDLKDLTLIGHSFGGGVSLLLALDKQRGISKRIKRLILINSIAYSQKIPIFFKLLRAPVAGPIGTRLAPPFLQARTALKIAYYDDRKISYRDVTAYAKPLSTPGGKHALIQTAKKINPNEFLHLENSYRNIRQPTLILLCDHDKIVPMKIGERLHVELPNSTLRYLNNCGHLPHEEKPAKTLEFIKAFLIQ